MKNTALETPKTQIPTHGDLQRLVSEVSALKSQLENLTSKLEAAMKDVMDFQQDVPQIINRLEDLEGTVRKMETRKKTQDRSVSKTTDVEQKDNTDE